MIRITDLEVPLTFDIKLLEEMAANRLNIDHLRIEHTQIAKQTLNARDKQNIFFIMTIVVSISGDENQVISSRKDKCVTKEAALSYTVPQRKKTAQVRPVVVGSGPAGLFATLILAEAGMRPILLERGLDVDSRTKSVLRFWQTGALDTQSNVQFGEGGAGTFSDGKLKIGYRDLRKMKVLREFVEAGAPPEILYLNKPHIGTDCLTDVVKKIRQKILSLGGEVHFCATVTDIIRKDGQVTGVRYLDHGTASELPASSVVLAIGHSARDTFERLLSSGILIEQKPFAVGLRVEHLQKMIDRILYGSFAGHPALGAADYKMVVHLQNGRGVYTFCMCPGGTVIAAASEPDGLTTNGMSHYARSGTNANTALLVTVDQKDIGSDHPLAGVAYLRKIEQAAFAAGGGGYRAPVQRLEDFICKRNTTAFGDVLPTYLPGTEFAEADSYLPAAIADSLRRAIPEMEAWMPSFAAPDALLTGVETRSASPVRITRGESLEAIGISGLYPCGEGAGYAGGIVSAAVDGILCAERILEGI
jgi:uncharacterized protein